MSEKILHLVGNCISLGLVKTGIRDWEDRLFRKGDSFPAITCLAMNLKRRILSIQHSLSPVGFIGGFAGIKKEFS